MPGFLLIDKPAGITSHGVIARLRRVTGIQRIGHAGTLDPFATGLLIVGVGREATRELGRFLKLDKTYEAVARLGATSDTQDLDGTITRTAGAALPEEPRVQEALAAFVGEQVQTPPMYSAKKKGGKKLYELARKGEEVAREPVPITVRSLALDRYEPPELAFTVECTSGTYVRTLAHDIGRTLGPGAYLTALRRTRIGPYKIEDAGRLDALTAENWEQHLAKI